MGLDQYASTIRHDDDNRDVDQDLQGGERLFYWRKHPDLHGWMERLYRERDGSEADFNCATVKLSLVDLDALEEDVKNNRLPRTEGFFFGESSEEDKADDLNFIKMAREKIAEGFDVYYDSWW